MIITNSKELYYIFSTNKSIKLHNSYYSSPKLNDKMCFSAVAVGSLPSGLAPKGPAGTTAPLTLSRPVFHIGDISNFEFANTGL